MDSQRLTAWGGCYYVAGTNLVNDKKVTSIVILADTVISILSGVDSENNPIDFKNLMGLNAGPTLTAGTLLIVPLNWRITQVQLTSGIVMLYL